MMKAKETSPAYLTQSKVFTYQDYLDLPEDGKRYEVINGDLIMVPGPNTDHQDVSGNLEFELRMFVKKHQMEKCMMRLMMLYFQNHYRKKYHRCPGFDNRNSFPCDRLLRPHRKERNLY